MTSPHHLCWEQFGFGQSNPSYQIKDAKGRKYVLRKKPPGLLESKTAHAVDREFHMLRASRNTQATCPPSYLSLPAWKNHRYWFLHYGLCWGQNFPWTVNAGLGCKKPHRVLARKRPANQLATLHSKVDPLAIEVAFRLYKAHGSRTTKLAQVAEPGCPGPGRGHRHWDWWKGWPYPGFEKAISWMKKNIPAPRVAHRPRRLQDWQLDFPPDRKSCRCHPWLGAVHYRLPGLCRSGQHFVAICVAGEIHSRVRVLGFLIPEATPCGSPNTRGTVGILREDCWLGSPPSLALSPSLSAPPSPTFSHCSWHQGRGLRAQQASSPNAATFAGLSPSWLASQ